MKAYRNISLKGTTSGGRRAVFPAVLKEQREKLSSAPKGSYLLPPNPGKFLLWVLNFHPL